VLTLGHAVSADHPRAQASQHFADTLKRRSGGRITVDVLGGASFGDDVAMLKALQDGSLDISANSQGPLSAFVPEINAFGLPFLFDRPEQAHRLLDGPLGEQLARRMAQAGFVALGFWDNGIRHFSNSVRPLLKPADFAGLRFRTPADPVAVDIVRALGAQAVEIRFSALYQALQRRTVDGQENPLINFHAARLHEVQTHLSLTAHKYEITPFVMSRRAWNALSPADRDMLRTVADDSTRHQRALTRKAEEEAYRGPARLGHPDQPDQPTGLRRGHPAGLQEMDCRSRRRLYPASGRGCRRMKVRHALIGGFGATLVAVLGVVLMAFLMLSQFAASWTEMSTVIASRHQVMLSGTLRLGYATVHFNNYLREGGDRGRALRR
jgi:tripartite ATP-independent transporter DctP family solute receptor